MDAVASWLSTDGVNESALREFDALWIAPGSPYRNMEGALTAIGYARENGVPLGGACAGFQHVILEYARNVLGFADAVHAEYGPPPGSRQVLAENEFNRIVPGQWTRADVEREFGPPARIEHVASWTGPIMTYRWRDADVRWCRCAVVAAAGPTTGASCLRAHTGRTRPDAAWRPALHA